MSERTDRDQARTCAKCGEVKADVKVSPPFAVLLCNWCWVNTHTGWTPPKDRR